MPELTITQMIENAGFLFATVFICISCVYFTLVRSKPEKLQNKIFMMIVFNIMICALCNITSILSAPHATENGIWYAIRTYPQYVYFLLHSHLAPLFCFYVSLVSGGLYRLKRKRTVFYQFPMYICLILVLINPFTHWVYYFDDAAKYYRGPAEMVIYVVSIGYFLFAILLIMVQWKAVGSDVRRVMSYFFFIVTLGTFVQFLFVDLRTELFAEALAMTGVMITLENEEGRRDSRTRIYNHAALNEDITRFFGVRKSFYLIVIKMQNPATMMQMVGASNIEKLTEITANYLTTLVPRYSIYYIGMGTFVIVNENNERDEQADREYNLKMARKIHERFKQPWLFQGRESVFNANVFCAGIPGELKSIRDVNMLIHSPAQMPQKGYDDVYSGGSLGFILRRGQVESAIVEGIKNRSFEVYYQPIYNAKDMSICAGEALLRLHSSEIGDIYPDEFLPIMERNGLIFDLGDFVLDEVCKFLNSGIPVEMGIETLNVNLSVVQCIQTHYAEHILQIVSKYDISPSKINFEIMESAASADFEALKTFVETLGAKGFRFSMDDYGIGYSNVHSLFALDVDIIKIDRTILWNADQSENGRVVMESTVDMIRRMNRKILISGVENQKQIDMANEFGVDYLQGFFFSNPINQNEFISILKATQLARIEEQKALAASEAMSNFLANMSHEIRTPINAVLGMDEMILRESGDERIQEYARVIEGAGRTLLSLINDILDFSKIEAGNLEIVESEYELSTVLTDVVNMVQIKAKQKGLSLLVDVDPELPERLNGDETRIRQVLLNILNNAVKYTKEGTVSLKVNCEWIDKHRIRLKAAILDTGIGIREEDMNKLFEKFHRLDLDKNKTVEGSGLGLAIAHRIVTQMDGRIKVESTYGKGSCFTVSFPQRVMSDTKIGNFRHRMAKKPEESVVSSHQAFTAEDARVLVVDDTPMNLVVVRELLKKTQVTMDEAMSGKDCLKLCDKQKYDLIILDYRMPEMDGIETLKLLRENTNGKNYTTTVVALTANAIAGARERFLSEGFDDYITKPVDGNRLEELLLMYLPSDKVKYSNAVHVESEVVQPEKESPGHKQPESWRDSLGIGATKLKKEEAPEGAAPPDGKSEEKTEEKPISEFDRSVGIKNCGSEESFERVFGAFQNDIKERSEMIRKSLAEGDIKRYQVEVHSIKGSARIIGAAKLSAFAEELEAAADAGDVRRLQQDTEELLVMYESFEVPPGEAFAQLEKRKEKERQKNRQEDQQTDKQVLTPGKWADALNTLRVFAESMDFDNAQMLVEAVRAHKKSKKTEEKIRSMESLIYKLKWDELVELIDELLEEGGEV